MVDEFLDRRIWIDVAVFASLGLLHFLAWGESLLHQEWQGTKVNNEAIGQAARGGVTALGILIASTFAVLNLADDSQGGLPRASQVDIFFAGLWFLAAIVLGLWIIWRLAVYPKDHEKVILDVGLAFGLQLLASAIGAGRLVYSLASAI